jgi:hypothetical protein
MRRVTLDEKKNAAQLAVANFRSSRIRETKRGILKELLMRLRACHFEEAL